MDIPKIEPFQGMKKAWGPYPEGKNISMYLEKPGVVATCAFAYVLVQYQFLLGR